MVSPANTIQASPVIQRGLDDLSPSKLKRGEFPKALAIIAKLGEQFRSIKELSPISQGRVSFIGDFLLTSLAKNKDLSIDKRIQCVLLEMVNLKNALQLETLFFGMIYPKILTHSRLNSSPLLIELREALPGIVDRISLENTDQAYFFIDADPVKKFFDGVMTDSLSDDFSILMLLFFSRFTEEGGRFKIPLYDLPPKEILEPFLESSNSDCKLIAQILYACSLESECLLSFATVSDLSDGMLTFLDYPVTYDPLRYQFDEYLTKKTLIPLFSAILEERDRFIKSGSSSKDILFSSEFLLKMSAYIQEDWLEESTDTYELIRKIELNLRRIFPAGHLTESTEKILQEGIDHRLFQIVETLKESVNKKKSSLKYPDPRTILQGAKEDFQFLAFYKFWQKEYELAEELHLKAEKSASAKKAKGKKKPAHKSPAAIGGSGSSSKATATPLELEEEPEALASAAAGPAPLKEAPKGRSLGTEAMHQASTFLRGISLAPRVAAWNTSPEAGLAYYKHGSSAGHVLPSDEMVLRHRFPPEILTLLFSDLYSKQSPIERPSGEVCKHWESVLEINRKKYMLEATVDSRGILFHYYARPLTRFADYFQLTKESPSEFPALGEKEPAPTPLPPISAEGITFDAQRNALFNFDGRSYKMLLLKK